MCKAVPFVDTQHWIALLVGIAAHHPQLEQALEGALDSMDDKHTKDCDYSVWDDELVKSPPGFYVIYLLFRRFAVDGVYTIERLRTLISSMTGLPPHRVFVSDWVSKHY